MTRVRLPSRSRRSPTGGGSAGHVFDLGRSTDGPPLLLSESGSPEPRGPSRFGPFRSMLEHLSLIDGGIVGVTNSRAHQGSGHVAAGLALAGASTGLRVALIGTQIEPIHGLSSEELSAGLHAAVALHKPLDEVLVPLATNSGSLLYLPPGPIDADFAEHAGPVAEIVEQLRAMVDLVVVELPPALERAAEFTAEVCFDSVVMCSSGRGTKEAVQAAVDHLTPSTAASIHRVHLTRQQPRPIFVGREATVDAEEPTQEDEVQTQNTEPVDPVTGTLDLRHPDDLGDPAVTVVIPCRNEESFIDDILASVQQQTHTDLEILVVDGMSTDRTLELVAKRAEADPRIRVLPNPAGIVSPGLNRALTEARGQWLVRIDAHCTVPVDYVARVVAHLETGDYSGVGGLKIGVGKTSAGRAIAAAMASPVGVGNSTYHHGESLQEVEHIPFGAYPVELARSIGGWDEQVVTNQDFEFDHRIRSTGKPILFDPEIVIFWHCRQSLGDLFAQYRRYGKGKSVVTRLHPSSIRPRHLVPPIFVAGAVALLLPTALLPARLAALIPVSRVAAFGSYATILTLGAWRAKATEPGQPKLSVGERLTTIGAFVAMHVGQGVGFWEGLGAALRRR